MLLFISNIIFLNDTFVPPAHRERLPPPAAGDEREALGLDGDAGSLDVLLDVPARAKRAEKITRVCWHFHFQYFNKDLSLSLASWPLVHYWF